MVGQVSRITMNSETNGHVRRWAEVGEGDNKHELVVGLVHVTHCEECGYSLEGLEVHGNGVTCPECGRHQCLSRVLWGTNAKAISAGAWVYMLAFVPCSLILTGAMAIATQGAVPWWLALTWSPVGLAVLGTMLFLTQRETRRRLWLDWMPAGLIANFLATFGLIVLAARAAPIF